MMKKYKNIDGDSNVSYYEIGDDYITVWFSGTARPYTYSYATAGAANVEHMKVLAELGDGLNGFINSKVRNKYVK